MDVALTDVATDTVGGFHLLPAATTEFAELFRRQPSRLARPLGRGQADGQRQLLSQAMVVPRRMAGDITSFTLSWPTAHRRYNREAPRYSSSNGGALAPLRDPATGDGARRSLMRQSSLLFRVAER